MTKRVQTLFFDGPSHAAIVVTNRDGRRSRKPSRIRDPHAALTWCIGRNIGFVYIPSAPGRN